MKTWALISTVFCASILIDAGQGTVVITSSAYPGRFIYYGNLQDSERVLEGVKSKQERGGAGGPTGPREFQWPLDSGSAFKGMSGRSPNKKRDSGAQRAALGSSGVIPGNTVQVPVNIPIYVCGSASYAGLINPTFGNSCANN